MWHCLFGSSWSFLVWFWFFGFFRWNLTLKLHRIFLKKYFWKLCDMKKHKGTSNCLSCIYLKFMKRGIQGQGAVLCLASSTQLLSSDKEAMLYSCWPCFQRSLVLWTTENKEEFPVTCCSCWLLKGSRMKSLSTTHTVSNHTGFPVLEWKLSGSHVFLFLFIHSEK